MNDQLMELMTNIINFDIATAGLKLAFAFLCVIIIKNVLTSVSEYFIFRFNQSVAVGMPIKHGDFVGRIHTLGLFSIKIQASNGDVKRVRIQDFWNSPVIFLDTSAVCKLNQ